MKSTPEHGSQTGADLQRGILRPQGVSRADGQGCSNEFADRGTKRNISVVDVERRFGLVNSTASGQRENVNHENGDDKSREARRQQQASV